MSRLAPWAPIAMLGLLMLSTALIAHRADSQAAELQRPPAVIDEIVPRAFSNWVTSHSPEFVNERLNRQVASVYDQVLERVYVNDQGERIMLSIAYSEQQLRDAEQAHRPEFCYAAQGFQILESGIVELSSPFGAVKSRRFSARRDQRAELVTYWMTLGGTRLLPGISRELIQLKLGLLGHPSNGWLIRVSSSGPVQNVNWPTIQESFIHQLGQSLQSDSASALFGDSSFEWSRLF